MQIHILEKNPCSHWQVGTEKWKFQQKYDYGVQSLKYLYLLEFFFFFEPYRIRLLKMGKKCKKIYILILNIDLPTNKMENKWSETTRKKKSMSFTL